MTAKTDRLAERLDQFETEYRSLLVNALRDCAAGRWGLFGHNEHLLPQGKLPDEVEELICSAQVIDDLRARLGLEPFLLHQRFQLARGPVQANGVGEPKQAKAWLADMDDA